nr:leucine-rich repeat protein [Tanacetum cinerariifolium]
MLSSWVGNDCCKWERVYCDKVTGKVDSLHLRGSTDGISGDDYLIGKEVITCLKDLRHLKFLDLSGNDFQGSRIPEFIGSFKQLSYLNLSNAFSGIIPPRIGNLSNLVVLDLKTVKTITKALMSDDMSWISGLSSLKSLDLSYVDLSKAQNRDMVFYMMPSLVKLSLSECGLTNADLEQETTVRELQSRLKLNSMESKLLTLKVESLQTENKRLVSQTANYNKVLSDLEAARAKIKLLKKKLLSETAQNKERILGLQQRFAVEKAELLQKLQRGVKLGAAAAAVTAAAGATMSGSKQDAKQASNVYDASDMLSSWVGNDCCKWERVHCDKVTGKVDSLHLRGRDDVVLDLKTPSLMSDDMSWISGLSSLKSLDLSYVDL